MTASAPPDLVIRRSTPDDAPGFARILGDPAVYPGVLQLPYADAALWRARLADMNKPQSTDISLVGVIDGEMVASAGLFTVAPILRRRHAVSLGITVDPGHQGRGVGSAMMAALTGFADNWAQVLRIELTVWTDNERAIALYRKHGFEIEGRHRAYALRDGRYVDALSMARLHPNPPRWE
jgi:putative acetyltransferase